jgi:hypothetical protein
MITKLPKHVWSSDHETQELILAFCKAEGVKVIAEIGACIGATTLELAEAGMKVYTCDIEDQLHDKVKKLKNVEFVLGNSVELYHKIRGKQVDAIYIDGEHSYKGVRDDFKIAEALEIPLIFIHDCFGIADVKKFVLEQSTNPHYFVIMVMTTHVDGYPNGLAIFKRK